MWTLFSFVRDALRVLHASLGVGREVVGLTLCLALFRFYEPAKSYLASQGFREPPEISGAWLAAGFASVYLIWRLLRHAIALHRAAKPVLSLKILDPGERYETYVAFGNRLLRLYHVELENGSRSRPATKASVCLESYQQAGDKRQVDIRSKLKVANSDADEVDLKPRSRIVFELCGVEAIGDGAAQRAEERESQTFSIVPVGSGTIRLLAEASNAPSREELYTLYVDATGAMTIRPQGGSLGTSG